MSHKQQHFKHLESDVLSVLYVHAIALPLHLYLLHALEIDYKHIYNNTNCETSLIYTYNNIFYFILFLWLFDISHVSTIFKNISSFTRRFDGVDKFFTACKLLSADGFFLEIPTAIDNTLEIISNGRKRASCNPCRDNTR